MKEIKFLLRILIIATYTSAVWGLFIWKPGTQTPTLGVISFFITIFGGAFILFLAVSYIVKHWNE